jgi:hypothetical protein
VPDGQSTRRALRALRQARRRRHVRDTDWTDSVYRAYLTLIGIGLGIFYLSPLLGNSAITAGVLAEIRGRGPSIAGACIAIVWTLGLRSGSHGGPLALEEPDVAHTLLAPVDRGQVLRAAAARQARGVLYMGAVTGSVFGYLAFLRLPGELWVWLAAATGTAVLIAVSAWGLALIGSGLRIHRRPANAVGLLVLGWAGIDLVLRSSTAPPAQLGRLALAPLQWSNWTVVGIAIALAMPLCGLAVISGVSLEAVQRRAGLVGPMRFAATVQDVRTVMVLHRQLSGEAPSRRPWWRVPTTRFGHPCWYRDLQGIAHWRCARLTRPLVLGVVAGLALVGVWVGATALVIVAGAALFIVGLDLAEGLGQEIDHPDRPNTCPRPWGDLLLHHLVVPACSSAIVAVVALTVVFAVTGSVTALGVTAIVLVPVAVAMSVSAGAALALGAPSTATFLSFGLSDLGPLLLVARQTFPPALVILALAPIAIAERSSANQIGSAVAFIPVVLVTLLGVGTWLRSRALGTG